MIIDYCDDPSEGIEQTAYAQRRLIAGIDRPVHLAALDALVAQDGDERGRGIVVSGVSGCGKTTLLAAWARKWADFHACGFIFQHYIGTTPDSASPYSILRRLAEDLKTHFNLRGEVSTDMTKMCEMVPVLLGQAAERGQIVIVLDGLDRLRDGDAEPNLDWIKSILHERVTLIASVTPGPDLHAVRKWKWAEYKLPLATEDETDAMISLFCELADLTLDADIRTQLVTAAGTKNPLFLRTMLEELRRLGNSKDLHPIVDHYLKADNPLDLFLRLINNWQQDVPQEQSAPHDLFRRTLTHLWATHHGLLPAELIMLLGEDGTPLPCECWNAVDPVLDPHILLCDSLLSIEHSSLRQAVQELFVPDADARQAAYLDLADYFVERPISGHTCDELLWTLQQAGHRERLRACLLDINRFYFSSGSNDYSQVRGYWAWLGEEQQMGEAYLAAFTQWAPTQEDRDFVAYMAKQISVLLNHAGQYSEALQVLRSAVQIIEDTWGEGTANTTEAMQNVGHYLCIIKQYQEAEPYYRSVLSHFEESLGAHHPYVALALKNVVDALENSGRSAEAEPIARRMQDIIAESGMSEEEIRSHSLSGAQIEQHEGRNVIVRTR